jgi:peptidoglycan/xylan/chitin deacetylase (PgdA/CDA1 family)
MGMAKFIFSGGNSGLYEIIRPPLLPLIVGLIWKLGVNVVLAAKLITLFFTLGAIYLTYVLGRELFNGRVGTIASLLLGISPVFFVFSTLTLTGIPASMFILLSILFVVKRRYFLSGLFTGLSFLMRFPAGLVLPVVGILFMIDFVHNRKKKSMKILLKYAILIILGFFIAVAPYFLSNYLFFKGEDIGAFEAMLKPISRVLWHQGNPAYLIRGTTLTSKIQDLIFYPVELLWKDSWNNPFFVFSLAGITLYFLKKRYESVRLNAIIIPLIFFIAYFTYITNKQIRFSLLFIPFLSLLSSYAIIEISSKIKDKQLKRIFKAILIIVFALFMVGLPSRAEPIFYYLERTDFHKNLNDLFVSNRIESPVMVTDPLPSAIIDNKLIFYGFSPSETLEKFELEFSGDTLVYNSAAFWCPGNYELCQQEKERVLRYLLKRYNTIFYQKYFRRDFYVFSKDFSIQPIDKELIETELPVTLSNNRLGVKSFVIFRMDKAFSIYREDKKNGFWNEKDMKNVLNIFDNNNIPLTCAIIPKDIEDMNTQNLSYMKNYLSKRKHIEIAQNGYSHTNLGGESEFVGLSYNKQLGRITKGRETIEKHLGIKPVIFMPPFNNADSTTLLVLNDEGYLVFSSTLGNRVDIKGNISRYDLDISFVAWEEGEPILKSVEELQQEFDHFYAYKDFIVITFSHTNLGEGGVNSLRDLVNYIKDKDVEIISFEEMDKWYRFRRNVDFNADNTSITIKIPQHLPQLDGLTLEFERSANYSFHSNYKRKLYLKNKNTKHINICLNTRCITIKPNAVVEVVDGFED